MVNISDKNVGVKSEKIYRTFYYMGTSTTDI